jgi:thiamine-phosphate pyrophosphorylase
MKGFLYGIVDLGYVASADVLRVTEQLVAGGIDLIQLRAKRVPQHEIVRLAKIMLTIMRPGGVPLILNDYPDLLAEVAADGCHVGQEDFTVAKARELAGRSCIVGKSTHSVEQAVRAQAEGADYIGFGPLFATATKPDVTAIGLSEVRVVHQQVKLPIYCIGGVKLANLGDVLAAGAKRVCIVSDLLLAKDIAKQTRTVKNLVLAADR